MDTIRTGYIAKLATRLSKYVYNVCNNNICTVPPPVILRKRELVGEKTVHGGGGWNKRYIYIITAVGRPSGRGKLLRIGRKTRRGKTWPSRESLKHWSVSTGWRRWRRRPWDHIFPSISGGKTLPPPKPTVNNNTWNSRTAVHDILWHIICVCVSRGYYLSVSLITQYFGRIRIIFCLKKNHLVTFPFSCCMTPIDVLLW